MPGVMVWCISRSCRPTISGRSNSATTAIQASSRPWSLKTWTLGVPWARSMMVLR